MDTFPSIKIFCHAPFRIVMNNISTIIWKDNVLENYLKEIPRRIELKWFLGPSAEELVNDVELENKTCLITGASGSIGIELSRCLSLRDCNVLMACRNIYKASKVAKRICEKSDRLTYYDLNLASLASVKECANRILQNEKKIDIVILNAATFGIPWTLTEDKLETTFQVSVTVAAAYTPPPQPFDVPLLGTGLLSHRREGFRAYTATLFQCELAGINDYCHIIVIITGTDCLTMLLMLDYNGKLHINWPTENILTPVLENVSLPKHEYTSIKSYNISKLCGVLLMHYLSNQWSGTEKSVFCAHPGSFIKTGLCRNWWPYEMLYILMLPFSKSVVQGASTIIYCATSPNLKGLTAAYFKNCKPCDESELAKNYYMSYRFHDLILEILRERVRDFDKVMCDFNSSKTM